MHGPRIILRHQGPNDQHHRAGDDDLICRSAGRPLRIVAGPPSDEQADANLEGRTEDGQEGAQG
jgi:hypothetical protein